MQTERETNPVPVDGDGSDPVCWHVFDVPVCEYPKDVLRALAFVGVRSTQTPPDDPNVCVVCLDIYRAITGGTA